MSVDFAPHNLTSNASNPTYYVSASSNFSTLPPWKAFDGGSTYWVGQGGGTDWLQLDIGIGATATLDYYQIQVNVVPEPARAPKNFTMQGSADGSTWTTLDTRTNETGWSSGETRTYNLAATSSAYRYFRLNITANNGDATYTQVAELYLLGTIITAQAADFAPHDLTSDTSHSPFVASASSVFATDAAYHAFDGTLVGALRWLGTGGGTDWLQLDCGSGVSATLLGYIVSIDGSEPTRAPKNWTMQGSADGSTWTTLDTRTNETGWGNDPRSYTCSVTTPFRYFRLNITANNGDATYTQVQELYLYGTTGGSPAAAQPIVFIIT